MSKICIYIEMETYLAQWFIHEQGGGVPVHLLRGSLESKILELYLQRRPDGVLPESAEGKLAIAIPTFRHKTPEVFNYLPEHATLALRNIIRNRFDVQLYSDLHNFGNITKRQDELIFAWMEKHEIELTEKHWNAIAKRYQRQRVLYIKREWAKNHPTQKKST